MSVNFDEIRESPSMTRKLSEDNKRENLPEDGESNEANEFFMHEPKDNYLSYDVERLIL